MNCLDLKANVWTVNNKNDMEWLIEKGVDSTTTNEPLLLQSLLEEKEVKVQKNFSFLFAYS